MRKEKWYNHGWVIGIGTTLLSILGTLLIDFIKDYPFLDTLKKCVKFFWNTILSTLNFDIKLWWLLITSFLIYLIVRWRKSNSNTLTPLDDLMRTYRVDTFGRTNTAKWTWNYRCEGLNITVIDVQPICPQCGSSAEIETRYMATNSANCSRCRLEGRTSTFNLNEYASDVMTEIIRRLKSNEWQTRMRNVDQRVV